MAEEEWKYRVLNIQMNVMLLYTMNVLFVVLELKWFALMTWTKELS